MTDTDLVERAVRNAHRGHPKGVRWGHVADTFAVGSTSATELCVRFGVDPCEEVGTDDLEPGDTCDRCGQEVVE